MRTATMCLLLSGWLGAFVPVAAASEPEPPTIAEIRQQLADNKAILVDVREKSEWLAGHLRVAQMLSLSDIRDRKGFEFLPKDKILYLHCRSGRRAKEAAQLLCELEYQARAVKEGYEDLLEAGFEKAPD